MLRVFLISPYTGDIKANVEYLMRCLRDSVDKGEAPFAPHAIYPQFMDEETERFLGIDIGLMWLESANKVVAYVDRGISNGMAQEIATAGMLSKVVEYRKIDNGR